MSQVIQIDKSLKQGSQQSSDTSQPVLDKIDSLDWNDLTVEIRSLNFSYQSTKKADYLLKNIDMTLPKSAIYGLLGPSGCGKTTLIKLILGRFQPSSGTVKVNGRKISDPNNQIPGIGVGFMPQEIALYREFSIKETLQYFARIYGVKNDFMEKRIQFLIKFLDLPDPERSVGVLSGGQKRRVSLAVAIVHDPPFLILDEPTVGVDPVLRERIWEHLVNLSTERSTSILVTTHYIEEARRAHIISLARSGTLLVEHSPDFLLRHFKVDNLEEVFLKVCLYEAKDSKYTIPKNYVESRPVSVNTSKTKKVVKTQDLNPSHWNKFMALVHKNFVRLLRNKLMLCVQIILPTIVMIIFCLCIGKPLFDLDIAVYNQELENPQSRESNSLLSSIFLKQINPKTISQNVYKTNASAYESVKEGETYGSLVIRKGFTEALMSRFQKPMIFATDQELFDSTMIFYGDLSNLMVFQTIYRALIEAELKFQNTIISMQMSSNNSNITINPIAVTPIINFSDPPIYGSLDPSYRDFMTPGIIICVVFILSVALTSLSFVVERKEGLLERTTVSGVKIYEVLFSQIAVQLIVLLAQTSLLLLVIFPIFGVENKGNFGFVILIIIMQGICGMSFGLFISSISHDEQSALVMALGSFFPYLLLSAIMWPLEGMSFALRGISYTLPQTLPVISLRNIMLRGWPLTKFFVWLGYVSTIGWTLIFISFTIIISSFRND